MARGNQRDEDFRSKQKHEREHKRKAYAKEYRHRLFGIWCFNIGHGGGWLKHGEAILAFRLQKHAQNTAASHYDEPYK